MSSNNYSQNAGSGQNFQSNNPYNNPSSFQHSPAPPQPQQQQQQSYGGYAPPPGPPPKRTETFREADFVPESERAQQREAMQQFEMGHQSRPQSQQDRDVEMLQREFPSLDGSLVAAIYHDAGSTGATREMLQELNEQSKEAALK
jgi:hypothetical protein